MDRIAAHNEEDAIRQLRAIYEPKGYEVVAEPKPGQLPDFVGNFRPDALLLGPGRNIIVEIKKFRSPAAKNAQAAALAKATESRPDWEFLLILLKPETVGWDARNLPDRDGIVAMIKAASLRLPDDSEQARFLQAWLLFEAAARQAVAQLEDHPRPESMPTVAVIERLGSHGLIEDDEVRELESLADVRNALTHGFLKQDVPKDGAVRLLDTARRLVALQEAA